MMDNGKYARYTADQVEALERAHFCSPSATHQEMPHPLQY